jgi:hypothetical protein
MALMKAAYKKDRETILEIFKFWHENGLLEDKGMMLFFLVYIFHTQGINRDQLTKMLDASKIDGGEITPLTQLATLNLNYL